MKARVLRLVKFAAYPLLYVACLAVFFYLTFPMRALESRIVAEFDRQQHIGRPPGEAGMTLEIGNISTYRLSGVELKDVRLTIPPPVDKPKPKGAFGGLDLGAKDAAPAKPSTLILDRVRARVRLLPLLIGRVRIDFRIDGFGGHIEGTAPYASPGDVEAAIDGLRLEQIEPLRALLQGQPLFGVVNGSVMLSPEEGKFAKADGKLELSIDDLRLFDGKTKLMGVALPAAQIGHLSVVARADKGQMTIDELSVQGKDLELAGEGRVRLNESYKRSLADIYLKFKFNDGYREKDDATAGLLGRRNEKGLIELPGSPFALAKIDDGFYRFHLSGHLDQLQVDPAGNGAGRRPIAPQFGRSPHLGAGSPMGAAGRAHFGASAEATPSESATAPQGSAPPAAVQAAPINLAPPSMFQPAKPREARPTQ